MSIVYGDNIKYLAKKPLDSRLLFSTISEMKEFSENYLPPLALCQNEEDRKVYRYDINNDIDETYGKWREFSNSLNSTQVIEMPEPTVNNVGAIVQYIGDTTDDYINAHFYKCVYSSSDSSYIWADKNVINGIKVTDYLPDDSVIGEEDFPDNSVFLKYNKDNGTASVYQAIKGKSYYLLLNEDQDKSIGYLSDTDITKFTIDDLVAIDITNYPLKIYTLKEAGYTVSNPVLSDDDTYVKTVNVNIDDTDYTFTMYTTTDPETEEVIPVSIDISYSEWKLINFTDQIITEFPVDPTDTTVPSAKLVKNSLPKGKRTTDSTDGFYSNIFGGAKKVTIPENWFGVYFSETDESGNHRFVFGSNNIENSTQVFFNKDGITTEDIPSTATVIIPAGAKVIATKTDGTIMTEKVKTTVSFNSSSSVGYINITNDNYSFKNYYGHLYIEAYIINGNTASGTNSLAIGQGTIASGENQTVIGKYNIADTENKYALIVGNGTSDTDRSNAFTVDWDGNITPNNIINNSSSSSVEFKKFIIDSCVISNGKINPTNLKVDAGYKVASIYIHPYIGSKTITVDGTEYTFNTITDYIISSFSYADDGTVTAVLNSTPTATHVVYAEILAYK